MPGPDRASETAVMKELLGRFLGKDTSIVLESSTRAEELGNMNAHTKPENTTNVIPIVFRGIYGLGESPIYVHGLRPISNKKTLFRNNLDIWTKEETGVPTYECDTKLVRLGYVDILDWFSRMFFSTDRGVAFQHLLAEKEAEDPHLAKKILEGMPDYRPRMWTPSSSIIDDPEFVEKAMKYLDRIV